MTEPSIPKLKRDWVGRYVRLKRQMRTGHGEIFEAGEVMLVTRNYGGLQLSPLYDCKECGRRVQGWITKVWEQDVELVSGNFEPATLPTRRELIEHVKDLTMKVHILLEGGKLYGPEGFTFSDGDHWERPGHGDGG